MEIDLFWTAIIAEFRFMKLSAETETAKVTEIIKVTVMILTSEK